MTFLQLAEKVIKEEKRPLSPSEIWQIAQAKGYDKEVVTKGKTPEATLGARLYVEVRDNPTSIFVATSSRPKRFVLRSLTNTVDDKILESQPVSIPKRQDYQEKDLHPFVVYYGFYYLKAYLKTIHHNKSHKREFGEWVHPDLVGCYFPFVDRETEVVEISSIMGDTAVRLFSFELKRELSFSNIRESFFQAVSNSSWAHEGYLAAADIDGDEDFRAELKRLSTAFGIGIIRIDISDPDSTEILFPARSKDSVDWETVNKLAAINPDFREFLKRVKTDLTSREIRKEMYDPVLDREDLLKSLAKKK
ncbi:MAG: HTH domain-containing protein [Anaerolineae bacterium]